MNHTGICYKSWRNLFTVILACCSSVVIYAQDSAYKQLRFNQYNASQGIPLVALAAVYKDSYNFLWMSTYYGVSIFNGKSFTNLPMYTEKGLYLGDYPHNFLQLDSNRMLISCSNGLFIFSYANSSVSRLQKEPQIQTGAKIRLLGWDIEHKQILVKSGSTIYRYNKNFSDSSAVHCINENKDVWVRNEDTKLNHYYYSSDAWLLSVNILNRKMDTVMYLPNAKDIIVVNGQLKNKIIIVTGNNIIEKELTKKNAEYTSIILQKIQHYLDWLAPVSSIRTETSGLAEMGCLQYIIPQLTLQYLRQSTQMYPEAPN